MNERGLLALTALSVVAVAACGTDVTVFGGATGGGDTTTSAGGMGGSSTGMSGGGGQGATGTGTGTGVGGECRDVSDCPVPDTPCILVDCVGGMCDSDPAPAGTSCGEGLECDGNGVCVAMVGDPCDSSADCTSGQCVDGVCCESACDGDCEACNLPGSEGMCLPHAPGSDPDDECPGVAVCDGTDSCVSGEHVTSDSFGGSGNQFARDVVTDVAGNIYVIGYFLETIDLGGGEFTSLGFRDVFVAKYDPTGNDLWSVHYGGAGSDYGWEIELDGNGDVIIAGYFRNTLDFGLANTPPLQTAGDLDTFVAKLDPNTGAAIWAEAFGGQGDQQLWGLDVHDATGEIAVGGFFDGSIDFGNGPLSSAGSADGFVAKLDGSGSHLWSHRYGDADDQRVYDVGFDPAGDVIVGGRHIGTIDLGGGTLTSAGDRDIFLAKLAGATGAHQWSVQYGDASAQLLWALDVDASGDIVLGGYNQGSVDFGGGAITVVGGQDMVVAKVDGMGNHLWSKGWGDPVNPGDDEIEDVHIDDQGRVILTGQAQGNLDFGGGPITNGGGGGDAPLIKLTSEGEHLWSYLFGGGGWEIGRGVTSDGLGNVILVGQHSATVDFGGGPLTSSGAFDAFVVKLAP